MKECEQKESGGCEKGGMRGKLQDMRKDINKEKKVIGEQVILHRQLSDKCNVFYDGSSSGGSVPSIIW